MKDEIKYKTFEELKEELGDNFEEYMYKANIELLNKMDKALKYVIYLGLKCKYRLNSGHLRKLKKILQGSEEND